MHSDASPRLGTGPFHRSRISRSFSSSSRRERGRSASPRSVIDVLERLGDLQKGGREMRATFAPTLSDKTRPFRAGAAPRSRDLEPPPTPTSSDASRRHAGDASAPARHVQVDALERHSSKDARGNASVNAQRTFPGPRALGGPTGVGKEAAGTKPSRRKIRVRASRSSPRLCGIVERSWQCTGAHS